MKKCNAAILALTSLLADCTTIDIQNDKPTKIAFSNKSPDEIRDCILQQGNPADFGYLKTIPFKGGTLITMDNGILVPNVIFAIHVIPHLNGSEVDIQTSRIGMGNVSMSEMYTKQCVG